MTPKRTRDAIRMQPDAATRKTHMKSQQKYRQRERDHILHHSAIGRNVTVTLIIVYAYIYGRTFFSFFFFILTYYKFTSRDNNILCSIGVGIV